MLFYIDLRIINSTILVCRLFIVKEICLFYSLTCANVFTYTTIITGESVRDGIISAYQFADADPFRAATHNKGTVLFGNIS